MRWRRLVFRWGFYPPPTGSLTGTAGGTIAENASSGAASIQWVVSNAVAPKVVVGTTTLSTSASGNQTVTLGQGSTAVALSDGALSLATVAISMDCVSPTIWNGSACTRPVYKYDRLNLVIFGDQHATIGVINGETVTPLANASEFSGNAGFPLVLCALWDKLLTDGRPLASCVTPLVGNTRRNFPINPLTGELMKEFKGAVPTGAVLEDVSDSGRIGPSDHVAANTPFYGMYIDVPKIGTYFFIGTDSVNLRLTSDGFATNKIIHVGDHKFLATYSNP